MSLQFSVMNILFFLEHTTINILMFRPNRLLSFHKRYGNLYVYLSTTKSENAHYVSFVAVQRLSGYNPQ